MKILIVDSDKERHDKFAENFYEHNLTSCYNAEDAINMLINNVFDALFIDCNTIAYSVAEWLSEHKEHQPKKVYIHGTNQTDALRTQSLLTSAIIAPELWNTKQ
jgi:DNA-binding NtrC family response regulator